MGDGLRIIAIPLLVYHLTGSAVSLGITYALEWLPFGLFGLVGGLLADRLDRRTTMIWCDLTRAIVVGMFAAGYAFGFLQLWMLYVGIAIISATGAIFMGGMASSIPYVLGKERATRAVSTLFATEQTVNSVAPPLGGALFDIVGPLPALVINAATYLFSLGAIGSTRTLGPDEPGPMPSLVDIGRDVGLGMRFLWADSALRVTTLALFIWNTFGMVFGVALIPMLKREFHASGLEVGLTFGISAAGAVAGSLAASRLHVRFGPTMIVGYAGAAVTMIPLAFLHSLPPFILCTTLSAVFGTFAVAEVVGWRMRVIPQDMIGRVFGAVRLFVVGGGLPGSLVAGWMIETCGVRFALMVAAAGLVLVALRLALSPLLWREHR